MPHDILGVICGLTQTQNLCKCSVDPEVFRVRRINRRFLPTSELDIHLSLLTTQTKIFVANTKLVLVRNIRVLKQINLKLNRTCQHKKTNRLLVEVKVEICKGEILRCRHVDGIRGRVDRFNCIKVKPRPRLKHLPASTGLCLSTNMYQMYE